jgi:hypothetical protein
MSSAASTELPSIKLMMVLDMALDICAPQRYAAAMSEPRRQP